MTNSTLLTLESRLLDMANPLASPAQPTDVVKKDDERNVEMVGNYTPPRMFKMHDFLLGQHGAKYEG